MHAHTVAASQRGLLEPEALQGAVHGGLGGQLEGRGHHQLLQPVRGGQVRQEHQRNAET